MEFEYLYTTRLKLRVIDEKVYAYIFDHFNDKELMQFFALETTEDLATEIQKHQKGVSTYNKSFLNFQLIDISSQKIIGWCGFHTWYTEHSRAEIGYHLISETSKNKGLMTEAFSAIIPYGFNIMKLNRIEAFISPTNMPSLKLVKKFGFIYEGHLRQHYNKNNVLEDSVVYALLKDDYSNIKSESI